MRTFVQALASIGSVVMVATGVGLVAPGVSFGQEAETAKEAAATPVAPTQPQAKKKNNNKQQSALSREAKRKAILAMLPKTIAADPNPGVMHFAGTCGASAAVTIDPTMVIVGSDDDNMIRTYDLVEPADLVVRDEAGNVDPKLSLIHRSRASQNFYKFLKVNQFSRRNFSAIEGAAAGDGFVFWTGSHARRKDGENRPNRRRFFATRIVDYWTVSTLEPYGIPVRNLLEQLESAEALKPIGLSNSIMSLYRRLEHLAPQFRGLEIQALSMAADGRTLLVALRNPLRGEDAIVVPLVNPLEFAGGEKGIFADALTLDLGGRGISAMAWVSKLDRHLILAGEKNASDGYQLFGWSGKEVDAPVMLQEMPAGFDAQSFIVSEDAKRLLVFSDDSELMHAVGGKDECRIKPDEGQCSCVNLIDYGPKNFRAIWVPIEAGDPSSSK